MTRNGMSAGLGWVGGTGCVRVINIVTIININYYYFYFYYYKNKNKSKSKSNNIKSWRGAAGARGGPGAAEPVERNGHRPGGGGGPA